MLGLVLALTACLAVLKDTVCASDRWQKLCFRSVDSLTLLRAVSNDKGLAARCWVLDAMWLLRLVLVLQLRQRRGLLRLVEVRVRRILIWIVLLFRSQRLLYERGVPLLRYDVDLIILATHGGLLTRLRALLEMKQRRGLL